MFRWIGENNDVAEKVKSVSARVVAMNFEDFAEVIQKLLHLLAAPLIVALVTSHVEWNGMRQQLRERDVTNDQWHQEALFSAEAV